MQSIILGIIQGASEFLPISSSGHLVIAPYLLGWQINPEEAFVFDVLVQVATLLAVIIYFWKDLVAIAGQFLAGLVNRKPFHSFQARLGWYLILATFPAGIAALLFKDTFEKAFSDPRSAAYFLLITSVLLIFGEWIGNRKRALDEINWVDSIVIGFFQVLALFPGVSRSGSTITGGLTRQFDRRSSARFSFLMAVPIMIAAGVLAVFDLLNSPALLSNIDVYLAGFAAAAAVGYLAIRWFIRYLSRQSLYIFAGYCFILGTAFLLFTSP
jgi:undecaprenyl-diphosphatase